MAQTSGKILKLRIESFKGIDNLTLEWEDGYAILGIMADGGVGKTSVMAFVEACMTGVVPDEAINLATKKAKGNLDFELDGKKYTIDISKTKKSETVKIRSEDNMAGGKEVIRRIVGPVAFSPFELVKMEPAEQVKEFKKIFNVDTTSLVSARQIVYDERTLINRSIKQINNWMQQNGIVIDEEFLKKLEQYAEPKELGELPAQLEHAKKINDERWLKQTNLGYAAKDKERLNLEIKELEKQIRAKEEELLTINDNVLKIENFLAENPEIPVTPIEQEIREIAEHNELRSNLTLVIAKQQELESYIAESAIKTKLIKEKDEEIQEYIKNAIPEMEDIKLYEPAVAEDGTVTEDRNGLYYQEKPISVLSTTEQITFGMALKEQINPNGLPVLILDDFESVGSLGREAVDEMAARGWQAIIAEVDPSQSTLKVVLKNTIKDAQPKVIKE
jgi:hypothetical protein